MEYNYIHLPLHSLDKIIALQTLHSEIPQLIQKGDLDLDYAPFHE